MFFLLLLLVLNISIAEICQEKAWNTQHYADEIDVLGDYTYTRSYSELAVTNYHTDTTVYYNLYGTVRGEIFMDQYYISLYPEYGIIISNITDFSTISQYECGTAVIPVSDFACLNSSYLLIARDTQLLFVNISNITNPTYIKSYYSTNIKTVFTNDPNEIYIGEDTVFTVLHMTSPTTFTKIGTLDTSFQIRHVYVHNNTAFVTTDSYAYIISLTLPYNILYMYISDGDYVLHSYVYNDLWLIAEFYAGFTGLNITNLASPTELFHFSHTTEDLVVVYPNIFVCGGYFVRIFNMISCNSPTATNTTLDFTSYSQKQLPFF